MKNIYFLLLNCILFTVGWYAARQYQLNQIPEYKGYTPSYKGTLKGKIEKELPIWEHFTTEEKIKGVYGYNKLK